MPLKFHITKHEKKTRGIKEGEKVNKGTNEAMMREPELEINWYRHISYNKKVQISRRQKGF